MVCLHRNATWLGQQLRDLRDTNGLMVKDVAEYLQRDPGTVSRFESGRYPIRRPDLMALLDLYGVSDHKRRESLMALSEDVWQKGWWDGYSGDVVGTLVDYVWLESRADVIKSYDAFVVPGLLQTADYARAVIRGGDPDVPPEQIERWVELRMARHSVLDNKEPRLSVILDESVVCREVGSPKVVAAQLRYLADCATEGMVDLRVLPFRSGVPASTEGAFKIFGMPDPFPEVAYSETLAGAIYVESPDTERFLRAYDGHRTQPLGSTESVDLIAAAVEEWQ